MGTTQRQKKYYVFSDSSKQILLYSPQEKRKYLVRNGARSKTWFN